MACIELTNDPHKPAELAEFFYDEAPKLLNELTAEGVENLPGGPAQVVPFLIKK